MLTGQTRYRLGWRKKMVLQVEHWCRSSSYPNPFTRTYSARWFDATYQDVIDLQAGKVVPSKPADENHHTPRPKRREALPDVKSEPPPMPACRPAYTPDLFGDRQRVIDACNAVIVNHNRPVEPARDATMWDVGSINYEFLGVTGEER